MSHPIVRHVAVAALAFAGLSAQASEVAYIASSGGYMLHNQGGAAVTRDWDGAGAIQGFTGYGAIRVDGQCLTGQSGSQPLRWESCRNGDKAQIWKLSGRKLNNELGWCADVQGNRGGAGVPVLAWNCSGATNQQWKALARESAQSFAGRQIRDPGVRNAFIQAARSARPGVVISTATGQVVSAGGANAVSAGGANVVSAGGGNVVSAGGMN
ncbi:RICIN domain-containing protein [Ramlibacter sp. AN1015]|uniref:RICIN domain-containing protein n=1 Tax=Ramlibacter sp. AN1015 TaxID=3133428 RepID=UPI0030BAEA60